MSKYQVAKEISKRLQKEFEEYDPLTQKLLVLRNIKTKEDAETFLNVHYENSVHDPFLMHDMKKVVKRILDAIKNEEKIVIYSDYDCDGIPGGVVLHDFFKKIKYEHFSNYIPHRHDEGYGLNSEAIKKFGKDGVTLVITVDCGISDKEPVEVAKELGIDVIVTDHHLESGTTPDAYAILNPNKKADKTYPFKGLCGAGVAFKLVQALIAKGDFNLVSGWDKWLLDMAGLSTIADMVPLTGENRTIARYGLHVLRKSRRPGLQQLLRKINVNQVGITEDDVGFMIGPRINAASRMDHPMDAFKLLSTDDVVEGGELAKYLDKLNRERKGMVAAMSRVANQKIDEMESISDVIVIGNPDWKPSLVGLVANSLSEAHNRPVFVWGRENGSNYKGSCRSDGVTNLVDLMGRAQEVFIESGGHAFSGGFSVKKDRIHDFDVVLNDAYKKLPKGSGEEPIIVDKKMEIDDVRWDTFKTIDQFSPFGMSNPKPTFLFEKVMVQKVEHFGKEKNHLRLFFHNTDGQEISAIAFFKTTSDYKKKIEEGKKVNLVASFEKSLFMRKLELRLRIIDVY